ncbi:hypothetical protein VTN96DRAFT_5325 [Rasamsonia emersonii]|uniref:Uncharacterized protein n=1 Tax=Rasamsonia emersonii (strain ATCC 16479 / CBS 393.64 / IMI 116815) TaxID=1408163 RepID=A0A0F4YR12_RASE3|nr:hypothetical protein T310_5250 [Rasamsonia emersonii CBS 393.64]KKA20712.1 hypothetical protein T310_5250 [Rasamsonia emersonii CBS 393.64]
MSDSSKTSIKEKGKKPAGHSHPSAEDVLQSHNYNKEHVKEFCGRLTTIPPPRSRQQEEKSTVQDLILSLTRHDEIQKWLQDPASRVLVLSGGSDPNQLAGWRAFEGEIPPVSGVSFVSAKLVQSLLEQATSSSSRDTSTSNNETVIPLACFCTLQRRRWHGTLTPKFLAMDLLLQLVDQYRDFDSEKMHACIYNTATLTDVCARFTELVLSMRPCTNNTTLFIVIDGCHELLSDEGRHLFLHDEWRVLFAHFERLLLLLHSSSNLEKKDEERRPMVTVKLLFAGPNATAFRLFTSVENVVVTLDERALREIECAWGKRV